jgi:hypothetical protein
VQDKFNANIRNIIYTYKHIWNMCQNLGLLDETKGGGKEKGLIDSE